MIKHITYITREYPPSFRAGGIATYVQETANILIRNGWKVTVICASDNTREESIVNENGVTVIRLSGGDFFLANVEKNLFWLKKLRFFYRFFTYRYKIRQIIQKLENVSLIEVPEYGAEGIFLLNLKIPLIVRLHGPMFLDRKTLSMKKIAFSNLHHYWLGYLELIVVKKAENITSCSDAMKRWFVEEVEIEQSKITTIYNSITLPESISLPRAKSKNHIVFFAGSILEEKGIGDLVKAIQMLREKGYEINLILAGKMAKYAHNLQQQLLSKKVSWCKFLGHLSERSELVCYYQSADVCCFPSWQENLPYVCLEAMSVGAIVIGTTKSGFEEIINEGVSGFLCPPQNATMLAEIVEKALNLSPIKRKIMAKNAIENIKNKFSKKAVQENINYYHLISNSLQRFQNGKSTSVYWK